MFQIFMVKYKKFLAPIAIFTLLTFIFFPKNGNDEFDIIKYRVAKIEVSKFMNYIKIYKLKNGEFPPNLRYLMNDIFCVEEQDLIDPWDNKFIYTQHKEHIEVMSYGADGRLGGAGFDADIRLSSHRKFKMKKKSKK